MTFARVRPVRSLPSRAVWRLNSSVSSLGESHGIDWLTYNPIQMYSYHQLALAAAPAAMRAIRDIFPTASSYVDVGAGSGAFAAEAARDGRRVVACERSRVGRLYARVQGVECHGLDLRKGTPSTLPGPFDLAYCFEVGEHLPPVLGGRLVDFLCGLAPVIVFSAAQPGQGGLAHVNERFPGYWIKRFEGVGYAYRDDLTDALHRALETRGATQIWLLDNTMVFCRDLGR